MGGGRGMLTQARFSTTAAQTCASPGLGARQFIPCGSAGITILAKLCLDFRLQAGFLTTAAQTCASPGLGARQFIPRGSAGITILANLCLDFKLQAGIFQRRLRKLAPVMV